MPSSIPEKREDNQPASGDVPPKLPPKNTGPSGTLVGEPGNKPPIPPRIPTQPRTVLPSSMRPEVVVAENFNLT